MATNGGIFSEVKTGVSGASLDKLAGLRTEAKNSTQEPGESGHGSETLDALRKRARAKFYSSNLAVGLANLNSPLQKSYWGTFHCSEVLEQIGKKITTRYCGQRWCTVCSRIRTGKLINGYHGPLSLLPEKMFVTLTLPNVPGAELRATILEMIATSKIIQDTLRQRHTRGKQAWQLVGLRKLECTYNWRSREFHPHFHFIVSGEAAAEALRAEWLARVPTATIKAQDIRLAREGSEKELFKYFSKLVTNVDGVRLTLLEPLDVIFQAMKGLRVFQPIGGLKHVSEDILDVQSVEVEGIESAPYHAYIKWYWSDWFYLETGEALTYNVPSEQMENLVKNTIPNLPLNYEKTTRKRRENGVKTP